MQEIERTECYITHDGMPLRGEILRYPGGQLGVQFYANANRPDEGIYAGSAWGRPSINIPGTRIGVEQMWLRTYDEHTGFLDAMAAAGVIRLAMPLRMTSSGEMLCDVMVPYPPITAGDTANLVIV